MLYYLNYEGNHDYNLLRNKVYNLFNEQKYFTIIYTKKHNVYTKFRGKIVIAK